MYTVIFLFMALAQLIALLLMVGLFQRDRSVCNHFCTGLAALVILGLVYDNLVIGLGSIIGEGLVLQALNAGRFYIHALVTPMLIMYAVAVADRLGVQWASSKITYTILGFLTLGLIGLGVYEDIIELALAPETESGLLRYINANSAGPPIPAIITIVLMIVMGAAIWRRRRWPILCVGSILMFIAAGAGASLLLVANFGETILAGTVVWTDHKIEALVDK